MGISSLAVFLEGGTKENSLMNPNPFSRARFASLQASESSIKRMKVMFRERVLSNHEKVARDSFY